MPGLIERYRDRLPFAADDPVVSLSEGSTPVVFAAWISEQVGAEVFLKVEGANPTGLVQGPRHDVRGLQRGARGRGGRHLRVDRQHGRVAGRVRGARPG